MIRVVLDANVLISGLLRPDGPPGLILKAWSERLFNLTSSPPIVKELERVLAYPKIRKITKMPDQEIEDFIQRMQRNSIMTSGLLDIGGVSADPSDDMFLACAVEGRADFLVTGDRHLLELGAYRGVQIVTPREFIAILQTQRVEAPPQLRNEE